ncbi:putative GTPase activating protein (Evi5) [Aspergillus clavatus NRRL 1]|uniref:GTPase activating protein (Evi5), putative n=1 Tax=Aspergillus clavatus (strain ATCC 1007 / CBS 513.65 / DSM 816 / NCTC 3887 / NRRL 1 / QM 1276 / 107) TaxID=344612 RepID=A1CUL1_ASPCL|nr:GTPase activating protein (Evi5), putative [Aspergillus clavatus NRRL 1]EAW06998.1 GTPase activating protein (Evi5), putative [Aspergillus clavatus NRRL 1]
MESSGTTASRAHHSDISLHNDEPTRPNHTDSMVTVPLSDVHSTSEHSQPDWRSLDIPPTPLGSDAYSGNEAERRTTPTQDDVKSDGRMDRAFDAAPSIRSRSSDEYDRGEGVDWEELDKTEEKEFRGERSDESTALLLARLEQENNALATNPKSVSQHRLHTRPSRAQSLHQIKRLINDDPRSSLRYSQLPPPPMTELEFWAALVADYPQTAQRLPTLTSNKIRGGIPPPLRGVVWPSLAGARDSSLLVEYQRLCGESSPYEGLIGKDIGRSFPNVEMFRDPHGEGQQMLAQVLKCFSLYDTKIGYCQGLGFVVGPLLMHMTDAEAFCVLVRLMDYYGLRTCYLPDLSGLHLRVYQFQNLLARHRPALFAHLESLNVEPIYVSQWFLSFFAVACPLPMLLRIYDVIFLEGACETLMRVALALMQRNEKKIMGYSEFDDVMQFLLSRSLWDTYACHADEFVNEFVSLTSLVTKESLQALEVSYNQSQGVPTGITFPQMQAAASRFLGRFWAGSSSQTKSFTLNPNSGSMSTRGSVRRSASKQSMTSTLNSVESTSDASTAPTELSAEPQKPRAKSAISHNKDRGLHSQIEDLLMALSDLQRQHADLTRELEQEREEREEDQELAKAMLNYIKELAPADPPTDLIRKAEERFIEAVPTKEVSIPQTKHQLREDLQRWKAMHEVEAGRCFDLTRRIDEHDQETASLREQLREARGRIQEGYRDRQRLERTVRELRSIKTSSPDTPPEMFGSPTSESGESRSTGGLRELKLVRSNSQKSTMFAKRSSSLGLQSVLATEQNRPAPEETLLLELVNAKTAEAVARQELEEVKARLDSLRKMIGNQDSLSRSNSFLTRSPSSAGKTLTEPANNTGGFFSGWGRRAASTTNDPYEVK